MKCHQCQKPVFYDLEDVVACLDCYYKIVQINNIRFLQAAAMANQALDDMDTIPSHAGMFKETDRLSVQLERVCCTLSFSEFFRTQCGIFSEKHLQILKYDYFSVVS